MPAGPWRPTDGADCDTGPVSTYAQLPPAPGIPRQRSAGAKALLAVGVVMAVLGGILAVIGFGLMADGAGSLAERSDEIRSGLELEVDAPGRAAVDLDEETYTIYVLDPLGAPTTPDATTPTTLSDGGTTASPEPMVRIIGADGQEVPQREPGLDAVADLVSGSVLPIGVFRVPEAGTYTVEVMRGDAQRIGIGEASGSGELIGRTVGGGVLGLLGIGLGIVGVALAIAGLIWLLASGGPPRPAPIASGWAPPMGPPTMGPHPGASFDPEQRPHPPVPPGPDSR